MQFIILSLIFFATFSCVYSLKFDFSHDDPPYKDCASHAGHHNHMQRLVDNLNKGVPVDVNCPEYTPHLLCIWKEKGIMNEAGILQIAVIRSHFSEATGDDEAGRKAEDCAIQKDTPGVTATSFFNCIAPLVKKYNPA